MMFVIPAGIDGARYFGSGMILDFNSLYGLFFYSIYWRRPGWSGARHGILPGRDQAQEHPEDRRRKPSAPFSVTPHLDHGVHAAGAGTDAKDSGMDPVPSHGMRIGRRI